jgi:hypothetical protein
MVVVPLAHWRLYMAAIRYARLVHEDVVQVPWMVELEGMGG